MALPKNGPGIPLSVWPLEPRIKLPLVNGIQDGTGTIREPAMRIVVAVHHLLVQDNMGVIGIEIVKATDPRVMRVEAEAEALRETDHPTTVVHQAEK